MSKSFFGSLFKTTSEATETLLGAPYRLSFTKEVYCRMKTEILFEKILHRCYSRSEGAKDEQKIASLFDSSERSGSPSGLISLVSSGMTKKEQLAIVYDNGIVRKATFDEEQVIKDDYEKVAKSSTGVLISFKDYYLTDLVNGYYGMIYDILASMNTQVGLAQALQIKINNLRGTVSVAGSDEPIKQAKDINEALKEGRSVLLDKNDQVEVLTINSDAVSSAITLVNSQLASDLGMPLSFVNGELTTGMSATGEADTNQQEEGLQDFFNSIFKPICDKLYEWDLRFVSDDWRYFSSMIGSLIIVENSGLLSPEQKKAFADRLMPISKN
jgi:hypothetical protein